MKNYFLLLDRQKAVIEARVLIMEPRTAKWKVVRSPLPATIGRGSDADVQIADAWVSRRHCELAEVDGAMVLRDLGSRHGTRIHGMKVTEMSILPGDEIMIGTTSLRVKLEASEFGGEAQAAAN